MKPELIDCPRCHGWGFYRDDKICLCCVETSQGFTPGKLPITEVKRLGLTSGLSDGLPVMFGQFLNPPEEVAELLKGEGDE